MLLNTILPEDAGVATAEDDEDNPKALEDSSDDAKDAAAVESEVMAKEEEADA